MTYILYNRSGSGGFVVQAALELSGADYRLELLPSLPNEDLTDRIGHLNPWGQVPVLVLEDGTVMTELAAILAHLAQVEPGLRDGPHLWVDNDALFLRWAVFLCVNAYEGILRQTYPHRFCTLSGNTAADEALMANISHAADTRTHQAFLRLEREIAGPFLFGERMSACDILLAMLYAWHNQRPDLPKCTAVTARVAMHPRINPIWHDNFDTRLRFKWHQQAEA